MRSATSREYKVMLEHRWFEQRKKGVKSLWEEVSFLAARDGIDVDGKFGASKKRTIMFFDTSDHLLRRSGLILRRRVEEDGKLRFTLKARNEDPYIAAGVNLDAGEGLKSKDKFEEDIAPPFRCRYSHSNTVKLKDDSESPFGSLPFSIGEAGALFPLLSSLRYGDEPVLEKTKLTPVNGITAHERVYVGPKLQLDGADSATAAVILWSHGWDGRPLVAEFSFRYEVNEEVSAKTAEQAKRFFESVQALDWCRPDTATKTQYVYREKPR